MFHRAFSTSVSHFSRCRYPTLFCLGLALTLGCTGEAEQEIPTDQNEQEFSTDQTEQEFPMPEYEARSAVEQERQRQRLEKMEEHFARGMALQLSPDGMVDFWIDYLAFYKKGGFTSPKDDELSHKAQEQLAYWQRVAAKVVTTRPAGPRTGSTPQAVTTTSARPQAGTTTAVPPQAVTNTSVRPRPVTTTSVRPRPVTTTSVRPRPADTQRPGTQTPSVPQPAPRSPGYTTSYANGLEALESKRWSEAADWFQKAIEKKREAGGRISISGSGRSVLYVPYYQLGLAFYHAGDVRAADGAWRMSAEQGILRRAWPKKQKEVDEYRAEIEADLAESREKSDRPAPAPQLSEEQFDAMRKAAERQLERAARKIEALDQPALREVVDGDPSLRARRNEGVEKLREARRIYRNASRSSGQAALEEVHALAVVAASILDEVELVVLRTRG